VTVCERFALIWERAQAISANARPADPRNAEYVAVDYWLKREPPIRGAGPCRCGCDDRWLCFARTQAALLYGQHRIWR
jgi:hypothetical protein